MCISSKQNYHDRRNFIIAQPPITILILNNVNINATTDIWIQVN